MSIQAKTDTKTGASPGTTLSRENIVQDAEKAIGEYARVIDGALADAGSLLNRALTETYAAVCDLQRDPARMQEFLTKKRSGPDSANPIKPVVRALWRGILSRHTFHRYASMFAFAQVKQVPPKDFREWLEKFDGGIKAAAAEWAKLQKKAKGEGANRAATAARDKIIAELGDPIPLPSEVGNRDAGLYLGLIRVSVDSNAVLLTVSGQMKPTDIDAFLRRVKK